MSKKKRLPPLGLISAGPKTHAGSPALNPTTLANQSPLGLFVDIEVARDAYEQGSDWRKWNADAEAQMMWDAPVQPRRRSNGGAAP